MKNKLLLLFLICHASANAQETTKIPIERQERDLQVMLQQYNSTRNAAGMGLYQPGNGSFTTLGVYSDGGNYHRVQEGSSNKGLIFETERYDSFSEKLHMRGSFKYNFDREYDRKWSDAMFPYHSNPYIFGSSIARRYETQNCKLTFDLYTAPLNGVVSLGIKTLYEVSDISGNRDPRPRTNYLNYSFIPSILFTIGSHHHIGINAGYGYQKEKLTSLTTVQSYPNLIYYTMFGLEHSSGTIGGYSGFKRQFISNNMIADFQYSYDSKDIRFLLSGGVSILRQQILGEKKQSPGSYNSINYNILANLLILGEKGRHNIVFDGNYLDGGANEYLQELQATKDEKTGITTETWITLYSYVNRFMTKSINTDILWKYTSVKNGGYKWSVGAKAGYFKFEDNYHLPHSVFSADNYSASIEGSFLALDRKGHKVDVLLNVSGTFNGNSTLNMATENIYGTEVLAHDLIYYQKNTLAIGGEIRYTFPLKIGKKNTVLGYASLKGGNLFATDSCNWYNAAVTIGLFTF